MTYLGDIALGSTIDLKFTTVNTSGVPTTLAGVPVVSAYPDNSITEITAGITLSVDFDGRTGMHNVRVVASSGNGYAAGSNYALVITTGTVSGSSVVGYVVGHFSIEARSALRPTTAGRTLDVSTTGEAGLDWANIGSPTTAQNLSGTNIDVDQVVASVSGAVGSVGAGGIAASSFAAGAIDNAAIAADAIGASELATSAVNEIRDSILSDSTPFPGARIDAAISSRLASASYTTPPTVGQIADATWDEPLAGHLGAGSTGEALSNAGGGSSPATIAAAVWDEPIAGHLTAGSTGAKLNSVAGGSGSGAIAFTYTLTNSITMLPLDGASVWATTDAAGLNIVASGVTNNFGQVIFYLDAGTYYFWQALAGYNFTNPEIEVVS